jgi:sugar lactone lactonase YvrE
MEGRLPDSNIRFVTDFAAVIGEGPLWSPHHAALYWIDTVTRKLMRMRAPFEKSEIRDLPYRPSCLASLPDGRLLVGYKKGVGLFDFDRGQALQLPLEGVSFENEIFNDGACDAAGRLWIGTRDRNVSSPLGALYRIGPDLKAERQADKLIVSNGLAWSPDGRTMYHTDSRPGRIDAYDFDMKAGRISNRRVFMDYASKHGHADGCTMDAEGCLWVAEVEGSRVARYSPEGKLDREIRLPVPKPTSVMFGGEKLSTLFVTSMRYGLSEEELAAAPNSGMIMAIDLDVQGLPEPDFILSEATEARAEAPSASARNGSRGLEDS